MEAKVQALGRKSEPSPVVAAELAVFKAYREELLLACKLQGEEKALYLRRVKVKYGYLSPGLVKSLGLSL